MGHVGMLSLRVTENRPRSATGGKDVSFSHVIKSLDMGDSRLGAVREFADQGPDSSCLSGLYF